MKKKTVSKQNHAPSAEDKSLFRQAGEIIGSIGAHIVEGKNKVVEFVSHEVTVVRKTVKKKLSKKPAAKKIAVKKNAKKSPPGQKGNTKFARKKKKAAKKSAANRLKK